MASHFNLVDQPWVPVADIGLVSLRQIYSRRDLTTLGGNPLQKIAVMKLLLAIAQAAVTPQDDSDWSAIGPNGLAERSLDYLDRWKERFSLYGDHPFLQMRAIEAARVLEYGAVLPEIATGNTTILSQTQVQQELEDSDKALLLVCLMAFALGGKKADNSVTLTAGYTGKLNAKSKPSSGKPGPAVAYMGLLHSFLVGESMVDSLWLNVLTRKQIDQTGMYPNGIGVPPWEQMPEGEDCAVAKDLKQSLMGRLVPLCRFCLLREEGLHYSEGLAHLDYLGGVVDPTVAVDSSRTKPKVLWVNPQKRPWRELTALLSFLADTASHGFQSWHIRFGLDRVRVLGSTFGVWSGGLRVSSNAGEQYVSGEDDFVDSVVWLHSDALGETWFVQFESEMAFLEDTGRKLYGGVAAYFKEQKSDGANLASHATHMFWQLCERDFQLLVDSCDLAAESETRRGRLRKRFGRYAQQAYDRYCPNETARQMEAWAQCRPAGVRVQIADGA